MAIFAPTTQAQIGIEVVVALAPPELPIYEQPSMPGPGFIWTPGYWAYAHEIHTAGSPPRPQEPPHQVAAPHPAPAPAGPRPAEREERK